MLGKLVRRFKQYLVELNTPPAQVSTKWQASALEIFERNIPVKAFVYDQGFRPNPSSPLYSPRRDYRLSMGIV